MKKNKIIIIGAGITGLVIARKLAEQGFDVDIFEKREHIAGNVYDHKLNGILVHKYGPHIFHTSKENVNDFMNQFWKLNSFKNVVKGYVKDKLVPIPFNFESIDILFSDIKEQIKSKLLELYPDKSSVPILELRKVEDKMINEVAEFVYQNVFLNYTTKMWNLKPDEIDESVTARIPIILSYRNTYFNDKYEGLPEEGYTAAFNKMIQHKNIKIFLGVDANDLIEEKDGKLLFKGEESIIVYTGPLDILFNNKFGLLEYRSLFFSFETLNQERFQSTAVVNYPADPKMTRITEYKNMTFQIDKDKTVIGKEFPGAYDQTSDKWNEPYYPLATDKAKNQYSKYYEYAKKFKNLFICGRLALYKYINMDQAIDDALNKAEEIIKYANK